MKTDELITLLATGAGPVEAPPATRRYAAAMAWGAAGAALLMLALLRLRADLWLAMTLPMFWIKIGFVASLAAASLYAALRLSRPGAEVAWIPLALALPVLGIWGVAAWALVEAEPMARGRLFFGDTWKTCPLLIAMLSVPVFAAVLRAMKNLAPTRLRLAGFAAGLLSGSVAAVVYCLHCPEMGAPFIGFWYLLGVLIPAGVGALLGQRVLAW